MSADESKFIIEVAQFMGGIDKVLTNIQHVLDTIPKIAESDNLKRELNELKVLINELRNAFSIYSTESIVCSEEVKTLLINLSTQLKDLEAFAHNYDPDDHTQHINELKKIHEQLCGTASNSLNTNIREAGKFAYAMQNEINRLEILFADKIKADDLKEVIEFAKTGNEIRKTWSGKKRVVIAAIGILLAALIFIDKIIYVGKFLDGIKNPQPILVETKDGNIFKFDGKTITLPSKEDLESLSND